MHKRRQRYTGDGSVKIQIQVMRFLREPIIMFTDCIEHSTEHSRLSLSLLDERFASNSVKHDWLFSVLSFASFDWEQEISSWVRLRRITGRPASPSAGCRCRRAWSSLACPGPARPARLPSSPSYDCCCYHNWWEWCSPSPRCSAWNHFNI